MKSLMLRKSLASDVATQNVDILEVNTDAASYARLGWGIVLIGVFGFMLWASLAPLDQGVPLSGTVVVASSRKMIQHQIGGTVDEVLVKNGDQVKAGQVLVKMNGVAANSNAEVSRVQLFSAQATEARLLAERDNSPKVVFSEDLEKAKSDPRVANNILLQQQLFTARQGSYRNEIAAVNENIAGLMLQLNGLEESMVNKKLQQQYLKEQLDGLRDLAKDGYVARNRLLDMERTYLQVSSSISEDLGRIGQSRRQVAELKLRKLQRQQDYQREVRTQLSDIQKEAEGLENRLKSLDFDLDNTLVRAQADGTVVELAVFSKGTVVPSGFKLMELVPKDDALIVDGMLPVHLVDKVHVGLKVELIFSAFNTNTTPHIPGVITGVSADRTTDERTGQAFYKIKAAVAPEGQKMIAHLQIRPGMPADMLVNTGERTMMNYLLKPILDRVYTSMKEE